MAAGNDRNQTGWRRLMGWLAAYLLVLHVGLAGASTGHFFAHASEAAHDAAFCLNGAAGPSSPADAPAHRAHQVHCLICSGGGSPALLSANAPADPPSTFAAARFPASEQAPVQSRRHSPNQSRAPPLSA